VATKKKQAPEPVTEDLFTGLNEEEQRNVMTRFKRLALGLRNLAQEFSEIVAVMESPKPDLAKSRKDVNDEPVFRYLVRVGIPDDIYLTRRMREYAKERGYSDDKDIERTFNECCEYYRRTGAKWQDWMLVIYKWFRTELVKRQNQRQQNTQLPRTSKTLREFK
jgi:hypothetical protein